MQLLTIQQLFEGEIVPALCRTFAHSLWQGLVLAIIAAAILVATRRSGSALRYNLLTGIYLLFVAGIIITFCVQLNNLTDVSHLASAITIDQPEKMCYQQHSFIRRPKSLLFHRLWLLLIAMLMSSPLPGSLFSSLKP